MTGTLFRNASGLPNPSQHSTARDLAILGLALREHFPQYYAYFSTRSFTYGRQRMANHNRLLGRVKGIDGIKTGYTRASGFNLVSSVGDGKRRIVAVVMGGQTGRARDNHMADLIKKYLPKASGARRRRPGRQADAARRSRSPWPNRRQPKHEARKPCARRPSPQPVAERRRRHGRRADRPGLCRTGAEAEGARRRRSDQHVIDGPAPSGWAIQVASTPDRGQAKSMLAKTGKQAPSVLADAAAYTVPFDKDGITYYRVRFGGFSSKSAAWNACSALKKKKIACYAVLE